tara:strand:+ start:131 stop:523 length:393 start_codon:yes stop_codon:yes gene_type:complete
MTTSLGYMSLSEINDNKPDFALMNEPLQQKIASSKAQELINQLHEKPDDEDNLGDFQSNPMEVEFDETPISSNNTELELITKINYMIQLLEETQDEKINNVTEEMILYVFLGVFVIFMIDSFTKVGKYVR